VSISFFSQNTKARLKRFEENEKVFETKNPVSKGLKFQKSKGQKFHKKIVKKEVTAH
jgi:hypothetical protein